LVKQSVLGEAKVMGGGASGFCIDLDKRDRKEKIR